jgi:hypothetical protein
MSGQKSSYLENKLLLNWLNASAFTFPATMYLALFTTLPVNGAGGTEATGGGYARLSVANNNTNWTVTTNSVTNATAQTMFTASGPVSASAPIVGFGYYDAASSGNLLWYAPVAVPAAITTSGQIPDFAIGTITITET